jgi:putative spermidine/putrescine transport system permease protein
LFTLTVASLIIPSILVSVGIGLSFNLADLGPTWYTSAFGAQLAWTLPFGLLIMFAVFNRFNRAWEEATLYLGASPWQRFRYVVLLIIAPSVVGVALFGFTLPTPLEIFGTTTNVTTPVLYALGTVTTGLSFLVIAAALAAMVMLRRAAIRSESANPAGQKDNRARTPPVRP